MAASWTGVGDGINGVGDWVAAGLVGGIIEGKIGVDDIPRLPQPANNQLNIKIHRHTAFKCCRFRSICADYTCILRYKNPLSAFRQWIFKRLFPSNLDLCNIESWG